MIKKIAKTPIRTSENDMTLSLPTTVHIELTSSCCFSCRHCYNFWREEKAKPVFMQQSELDRILDVLIKNNIMHVIFTGGEPLLNSSVLEHGIRRMKSAGASVTCNSTLAVANSVDRLKVLKEAGLEHILTSLNSNDPAKNDYLVSYPGAQKKIIDGISNAISVGMRISVNMIISETNIGDIYETAKLASKLGARKFFGTRVAPHITKNVNEQKEFLIYKEEARRIIDTLMRVEKDFPMQVGTLVPFPLCMLVGDDEKIKYAKFYSHGCPAGNKMISINANGDAHACVHEKDSYGNIFVLGLKEIWSNMKKWRSGEYFPGECKACEMFDECNGGCRLCALAYTGSISSPDILRTGWAAKKRTVLSRGKSVPELKNMMCLVPSTLRFRKEDGFYMIDRFGSEILCVKDSIAIQLLKYQTECVSFSPAEAGLDADIVGELLKEKILIREGSSNAA